MLTSDCLSRLVTIQEEAESSASVEVTPVASDTFSIDYLIFHLNRLDSAFPVAEIIEHPRQDFLMPEKLQYGIGEINKTEGSDELLCAIAYDTFGLRFHEHHTAFTRTKYFFYLKSYLRITFPMNLPHFF